MIEERPRVNIIRIFNWRRRYGSRFILLIMFMVSFIFMYLRRLETMSSGNLGVPDLEFVTYLSSTGKNLTPTRRLHALSAEERRAMDEFLSNFPNVTWCPEVIGDDHPSDEEQMDKDTWMDHGPNVKLGGWWQPVGCKARHTTAIVIPYRDRQHHLRTLLWKLHEILQLQMISYRIFVVEQNGTGLFNKGALFNAAYLIIREHFGTYLNECIIFHDVDLIPEDERNLYTCPHPTLNAVRHMSVAVDKMKYELPYPELVGGVLAIPIATFLRVNGYSNLYQGWGGEDDDMWYRLEAEGIRVLRPPLVIGRYKMLPHPGRPLAMNRYRLLRTSKSRYRQDGIAQMEIGNAYNIVSIAENQMYTHILVSVNCAASWLGGGLRIPIKWCFIFLALFIIRRHFIS